MSGIRKVEQPKGKQPKIVGAAPLTDKEPTVLDAHSKPGATVIPNRAHGNVVPVREHVRSKPKKNEQ